MWPAGDLRKLLKWGDLILPNTPNIRLPGRCGSPRSSEGCRRGRARRVQGTRRSSGRPRGSPIKKAVPPAPWSVPREPFSSGRRPNSDQRRVTTRSARPPRLEVTLEGEQRFGHRIQGRRRSCPPWPSCVSYPPAALSAAQRIGRLASSIDPRAARLRHGKSVGIGQAGTSSSGRLSSSWRTRIACPETSPRLGEAGIRAGRVQVADPGRPRTSAGLMPSSQTPGVQRSYSGPSTAATGTLEVASAGDSHPVEREALQRIVHRPDHVEEAAHPAGAALDRELAHLPVMTGGEVRLVGVVVADRREDRDLPLPRAACAASSPSDASAGWSSSPNSSPSSGSSRSVGRHWRYLLSLTGARIESESAPPSRKTETSTRWSTAEAWALAIPASSSEKPTRRGAVHREHRGAGAQQERAAVEPGSGRKRHPRLDGGQALPGLGGRLADERGSGVLSAVAGHQLACWSGEVATSARSAFWRSARKVPRCQSPSISSSTPSPKATSWSRVVCEMLG